MNRKVIDAMVVALLIGTFAAWAADVVQASDLPRAAVNASDGDFWSEDVWSRPDRPFLFYGESRVREERQESRERAVREVKTERVETPQKTKADDEKAQKPMRQKEDPDAPLSAQEESDGMAALKSLASLSDLRTEVKTRLETAVMRPSAKTIGLYLQANAFLMDKAGVFAEKWRSHLIELPQYDWTAQHPTVNAASIELAHMKQTQLEADVKAMSTDWGFVLVGDASPMTDIMAGIVEDFSRIHGFELVTVSTVANNPYLMGSRVDPELPGRLARPVGQFPALLLVNRTDKTYADARLIATGVVDGQELMRRTASFYPVNRPDAYARGWLKVTNSVSNGVSDAGTP